MTSEQWKKYLRKHGGHLGYIPAATKLWQQNRGAPQDECIVETSNLMVAFAAICVESLNCLMLKDCSNDNTPEAG